MRLSFSRFKPKVLSGKSKLFLGTTGKPETHLSVAGFFVLPKRACYIEEHNVLNSTL